MRLGARIRYQRIRLKSYHLGLAPVIFGLKLERQDRSGPGSG